MSQIVSQEIAAVVRSRHSQLVNEQRTLEEAIAETTASLAKVTSELSHLEGLLQLYGATAPTSSAAVSSPSQATADDVVELLRQTGGPLHYTAIESELRARGFLTAGGKNPANTLLARYFNDPRLTRPKRGTYTLRTEIRE